MAYAAACLQLREARVLVGRVMPDQQAPEAHVAAVSAALARGLAPAIVERLLTVAPNEPPGRSCTPLPISWRTASIPIRPPILLVEAHNKGLHGMRLLDVAVAADHELQRAGGGTHADALARVRALLPNVPTAEVRPL